MTSDYKQMNRASREYMKAIKRHYGRHTLWMDYAIAQRLNPTGEECPF